jgi:hypothetical protein
MYGSETYPPTLSKEYGLRMFENNVMRKYFVIFAQSKIYRAKEGV